MNGHPTYKPKAKKKPTTGLFPMHEATTKKAAVKPQAK